jgi:hypothetical protein
MWSLADSAREHEEPAVERLLLGGFLVMYWLDPDIRN